MARVPEVTWLAECSAAALRGALQAVAPDLSGYPLTVPGPTAKEDPVWQSGATIVDERFVVKFAWSRPAALSLTREIGALTALTALTAVTGEPRVPFLPEIVASSASPLLLITRRVPGRSLFEVVDSIDRDRAGWQLARFLAALRQPATRERAEAAVGRLTGTEFPPAATRVLRDRFGDWIPPGQHEVVMRWCDWADGVLASPAPAVLVHGDLHGDNQVWDGDELRVVVDFATVGAAEPEYDLRTFPGPGMGPGVELLTATMRHYQQITGRRLSLPRIMAWHVRAALGDALWRSEAGIPLADHRTPPEWVDDLAARFRSVGIDPRALGALPGHCQRQLNVSAETLCAYFHKREMLVATSPAWIWQAREQRVSALSPVPDVTGRSRRGAVFEQRGWKWPPGGPQVSPLF